MDQQRYNSIEIQPASGPVDFTIRPPGSKSITNRALLCAAMANGQSVLAGALASEDTRVMIQCLRGLGIQIVESDNGKTLAVSGCAGQLPNSNASLFVENSGTTIRFLTASLGIHGGEFRLHGIDRMHQRPIGPLVDTLNQMGANAKTESHGACPPVMLSNERLDGGTATVSGNISSQYLSGLMMGAPLANGGLSIQVDGELVSKPYIEMTRAVMNAFGVQSKLNVSSRQNVFEVRSEQSYSCSNFAIEPDASAASYFWATAAICGGNATIEGLSRSSLQGDVRFVDCLERMGCKIEYGENDITVSGKALHGVDVDMAEISDTAQTVAAVALFVDGPTRIRGVAHNRVKETDRIGDLATELRKFGATVQEFNDGLSITPGILMPAKIETYNDHRMAMSLSLVGLRNPGTIISNPNCTAKTYPNFFEDLESKIG